MKTAKTKIAQNAFQQGDVLGRKIDVLPAGEAKLIKRTKRGWVLAEGEVTNHAHVIDSDDAELIQIGEKMLLRLTKAATVTHEEHKPIRLSPGLWEIGIVKEYDWLSEVARNVQD